MKRKIVALAVTALIVVILACFMYTHMKNRPMGRLNEDKTAHLETKNHLFSSNDMPKPLDELFDERSYAEELERKQSQHKPEEIKDDSADAKGNRKNFSRPEDVGEDFSKNSIEEILGKLKEGDKVEQRKAANALWKKYGANMGELTNDERNEISHCTLKYLSQITSDFEENFMQIQRLWHLAVPALLENVINPDSSISENSARLLSVMKTQQIIELLIGKSDTAKSAVELGKYIFALECMKINNRFFLENRKRMSDIECKNYYNNKVVPQIKKLTQELEKSK